MAPPKHVSLTRFLHDGHAEKLVNDACVGGACVIGNLSVTRYDTIRCDWFFSPSYQQKWQASCCF